MPDWLFATELRRRTDVAAVLTEAATADEGRWVQVERFGSQVLEGTFEGNRYVVFSNARQRPDTARRLQLIAKIERQLLALENRVRRGDLTAATDIAGAAATIMARSPVKLFDVSDVAEGRFVYDYDHDALAQDEQLASHYVLATSLDLGIADAAMVLARYRSLHVEQRFRVLESSLGCGPSATSPRTGSEATSPSVSARPWPSR